MEAQGRSISFVKVKPEKSSLFSIRQDKKLCELEARSAIINEISRRVKLTEQAIFQVVTATRMKTTVFWYVPQCSHRLEDGGSKHH